MARVYLNDEIQSAGRPAIRLIETALRDIAQAENKIENMLEAGATPADIEAYGTTRYKLAGLMINQAISELENLNIDPTDGLKFPSVVDLRSPRDLTYATIGNIDDSADANFTDGAGNRLTIIGKPQHRNIVIADIAVAFDNANAGEFFKITKFEGHTDKTAVGGTVDGTWLGLEGQVLVQGIMAADAIFVDITDELLEDIPWEDGYPFLRMDINLNKLFTGVDSFLNDDATPTPPRSVLDMMCKVLQMREIEY